MRILYRLRSNKRLRRRLQLSLILSLLIACDETNKVTSNIDEPPSAGAQAGVMSAGGMGGAAGDEVIAGGEVEAGVRSAGAEGPGGLESGSWTTAEIYEGLKPSCAACHGENLSLPLFESLAQFERLIVANTDWVVSGAPDQSAFSTF